MPEIDPQSRHTVAYIRRSTFQQENQHQLEAIEEWLDRHDLDPSRVEFFSETASGASRNREQLKAMMTQIETGDVDHVVVWELSRIAREGELAQRFFNLCEDNDVHVHVTSGSIREIKPDGTNRFVADILAAVYAEERRTLIRRTKWGQKRARNQDKWVCQPPLGFTTDDDGYLIVNLGENPDRDGFFAIQDALEALDAGESQRSVAKTLEASRPGIVRVWRDDEKRRWFSELEAEDGRVDSALEFIRDDRKEDL